MGATAGSRLQGVFVPVGLVLFSVLTVLLALLALNTPTLERAGLWPHAYFLAIAAQWGALGLACVGLCARTARPLWSGHARWRGKGPALAALLLFHTLMAVASICMGFADALVGGTKLPGYLVELLPREGQLIAMLAATWFFMVLGASFLWVYSRVTPKPPRAHAPVVAVTLLVGAVAYWGWGWSRFYPTFAGEWFSLWKVGALDIAVEGTIFRTLLWAMPLVHACIVGWLAVQLLRTPLAAAAAAPTPAAPR